MLITVLAFHSITAQRPKETVFENGGVPSTQSQRRPTPCSVRSQQKNQADARPAGLQPSRLRKTALHTNDPTVTPSASIKKLIMVCTPSRAPWLLMP